MSWLDHLTNSWKKQAAEQDTDISQGPPNLRASVTLGPACDKCAFYNLGMSTCRKYGVQTHPQQVCDDFEEPAVKLGMFPPQGPSDSATLAQPVLKPIAPVPLADGSRARPGRPAAHPATPQPPNNRQPSVVAQVTQDPQTANIMRMFSPPPQQKQGMVILNGIFIDALMRHKPLVMGPPTGTQKLAARHAVGDPLPKDWNMELVEPNKANGSLRSDGREAWDSVKGYRRKDADRNNFDKAWHTSKGKEK